MTQDIRAPLKNELDEISQMIDLGMNIMAHYGIDQDVDIFNNLDSVYDSWVNDGNEKPSSSDIVAGLGSVFGDRLSHAHQSDWIVVTDEYGTDFGILVYGYQIFPLDFVAKRVATLDSEDPEMEFFSGMNSVINNEFKNNAE